MASSGRRTADALTANAPRSAGDAADLVPAAREPAAKRWQPGSVAARLFAEGYVFDFFQAVRLLQLLDPQRAAVGYGAVPAAEVVRFRSLVSLNFPPSAIYDLRQAPDAQRPHSMTVTFLGLTGPSGVLPRHYTELLLRLQRDSKDQDKNALRDWLDLYNHRLLSLFYRCWEKYRFWVAYERGEATRPQPDPFTNSLFSLIGLGMPALRNRLRIAACEDSDGRPREHVLARVDDLALIYYSGLLAHRPRSALGLARLLEDYLALPVEVRQFQGQWLALGRDNQSRLGVADGNSELGVNLVLGERVWDVQSKLRIRVGPLTYAQFQEFIPDRAPIPMRKEFFKLVHLVRLYVGPEFDFDIRLILKADEVVECRLPEATADGPQLGWNTWLSSLSFAADAEDAVFEGVEVVWVNR